MKNSEIEISTLKINDVDDVDDLMKHNSSTLGFLPKEALEQHLETENVLGAKTNNEKLAGYLLFTRVISKNMVHINYLSIHKDFQRQGIAKQLFNALKKKAENTNTVAIYLWCRHDYTVPNLMWENFGFIPVAEKAGRSRAGHPLTFWKLPLIQSSQLDLDLFRTSMYDDAQKIVIDTNIFLDFYSQDKRVSDTAEASKALLSDSYKPELSIFVTNELLVEINRQNDKNRRDYLRQKINDFPEIGRTLNTHKSHDSFEQRLKGRLPHKTRRELSDIRHLAKTAASDVDIFVTRDENLLNKKEEILEVTNVQVLSPIETILQIPKQANQTNYENVSGSRLKWETISSNLSSISFRNFLNKQERQNSFKKEIENFLIDNERYKCELLKDEDTIAAIRVLEITNKAFILKCARVSTQISEKQQSLFHTFLIKDTLYRTIKEKLNLVKCSNQSLSPSFTRSLLKSGFVECNDSFIRFCFPCCLTRKEVLSKIGNSYNQALDVYKAMSDIELEGYCSPLTLNSVDQQYLLIPIRPAYAISLVDIEGAKDDLFGGNIDVLARWEQVYYRKATRNITTPARILWYVSGEKKIVAVSRLDEVAVGLPKDLFKKFKLAGVLEWQNLYDMCQQDISTEIMVLKFSHTFPFNNPISLQDIRSVYQENSKKPFLQSISPMSITTFQKLFRKGY